jgi:uncharacterized protein
MTHAFRAISAAAFLMLSVASSIAGPFEDAGAAFDRGDCATAQRLFRSLADQGDVAAHTVLG